MDLGAQLRSPDSPERFRWRLDLPDGARLQLSSTEPGAEIIAADGAKLAHITAPVAWDADDVEVKTALAVEGHDLVVDVAHRDADVRYPVMLDPTILEDGAHWFSNSSTAVDLTGWKWSDPNSRFTYFYGAAYLGNGMYTYSRGTQGVHRRRLRQLVLQRARHVADRARRVQLRQARAADHRLLARAVQRRPLLPGRLELHQQPLRDGHLV